MWKEPAFWVVVFALIASLISRFFPVKSSDIVVLPSIFVGVVSFCDEHWPDMVQRIIDSAYARDTLRIGVVEFVRSAVETQEPYIPAEWRRIVSVYTVSHRTATTMRAARTLCTDELYRNEPYIMFIRGANLQMNWDRNLIDSMTNNVVISTRLDPKGRATFPSFIDGTIIHRSLFETSEESANLVPTLIIQLEFVFFASDALKTILFTSDDFALSAKLTEEGYSLMVPNFSVASRSRVPAGVSRGKLGTRPQFAHEYADRNGFGKAPTAQGRLGLTPEADSAEIIAKYGSIVGARLAIQEEEAMMKSERASKRKKEFQI